MPLQQSKKLRNLTLLSSLMDNLPVIELPVFREGWLPSKSFPIHASCHSTCIIFRTESIVKAILLPQKIRHSVQVSNYPKTCFESMSLISTVMWAEELKSSLFWNGNYKFINCSILHTYNKK